MPVPTRGGAYEGAVRGAVPEMRAASERGRAAAYREEEPERPAMRTGAETPCPTLPAGRLREGLEGAATDERLAPESRFTSSNESIFAWLPNGVRSS